MTPKNHAAYGDQSPQGEDEALEAALRHLEISTSRAEQALDQALADVRSALNESTLHWLLAVSPAATPRSKAVIDADLAAERDW